MRVRRPTSRRLLIGGALRPRDASRAQKAKVVVHSFLRCLDCPPLSPPYPSYLLLQLISLPPTFLLLSSSCRTLFFFNFPAFFSLRFIQFFVCSLRLSLLYNLFIYYYVSVLPCIFYQLHFFLVDVFFFFLQMCTCASCSERI